MSTPKPKLARKPRRDAKLLGLPERDRKLVAGWLQSDGWQACLQRIATQLQIRCGKSALYEALAYWESEERRDRVRAKAFAQIESEAAEKGYTPQQRMAALDRRMAEIFAAEDQHKEYQDARYLMIADESARTKGELEKVKLKLKERGLAQKDREIWIAMERLLDDKSEWMLSDAARAKADEINASGMSHAEKIKAMRAAAFADVDAMQKSGKVVLPE